MINDCANADVRDLLPDLVHGRLDAATRDMVQSHLDGCADCRAEVELLWAAARALSHAPKVDVGRIVAALPAPAAASRSRTARPAFQLEGWRRAAAVVAVAAGLLAVGVWQQSGRPGSGPDAPPPAGPTLAGNAESTAVAPGDTARRDATPSGQASPTPPTQRQLPSPPASESQMLAVGELSGLSDDQLQSVLASLDDIDGIPSAEPEPAAVPTRLPGGGERLQ